MIDDRGRIPKSATVQSVYRDSLGNPIRLKYTSGHYLDYVPADRGGVDSLDVHGSPINRRFNEDYLKYSMSPKRHEESMKDYLEGRSEGFYDLFQNRIPNTYNKYKEDAKDWLHAGQLAGMGLTLTGPGAVVGVPLTAASTAGLGVINGIDGLVNLSKGEYIKALGNFGEIGLDLLPARAFTKLSTKALPYTERTIIRGNKYYRSALRNVRNVVNGVPTTSNANVYLRMKASDIIGVSNIGMRYIGNAGMRAVNNYIQTTPGGQLTPLNPNTHHLTGDVTRMTDFTRPDYRFRDAFNKGRMGYDVFDGGRHYYDRYINNNNPTSTTNNDDLNKR